MINLLIYYLSTLVREELATLEQICSVYVPVGVDHTTFSSIIRYVAGREEGRGGNYVFI